jgi:anti-anti-sigma factor
MSTVRMREGENEFVGGIVFHKRAKIILESLPVGSKLTIDLNNYYLDSSVIGTLLAIHASCRKKNCDMELINISPQTLRIMKLSGLDRILELKPDEKETPKA